MLTLAKYRILKDGNVLVDWTAGSITNYSVTNSASVTHQGVYTFEITNDVCVDRAHINIDVVEKAVEVLHDKQNNIVTQNGVELIKMVEGDFITFSSNIQSSNYTAHWEYGDGFENTGNPSRHYFNIPGQYNVKMELVNNTTGCIFCRAYRQAQIIRARSGGQVCFQKSQCSQKVSSICEPFDSAICAVTRQTSSALVIAGNHSFAGITRQVIACFIYVGCMNTIRVFDAYSLFLL